MTNFLLLVISSQKSLGARKARQWAFSRFISVDCDLNLFFYEEGELKRGSSTILPEKVPTYQ
jgi:hypothetical protein